MTYSMLIKLAPSIAARGFGSTPAAAYKDAIRSLIFQSIEVLNDKPCTVFYADDEIGDGVLFSGNVETFVKYNVAQ